MDTRNAAEAIREARLDETEGADMWMVKPALAYLDVIRHLPRPEVKVSLFATTAGG